jgi:hypothetical protein
MEEFESINTRMPDLQTALMARVASRTGESAVPTGKVDPYQVMLNRKRGIEPDLPPVQEHSSETVKKLQDYCQKMGIIGFNCGRMNPLAALQMLKNQLGDFQGETAYEDRIEPGYQKLGIKDESVSKPGRQVLHG